MKMGNRYVHEAYSAIFQQDYKRAIEAFRKAIRLHPRDHTLFYKLSVTYARNNEIEKSLEAIHEAIKLDMDNESYKLHLMSLEIRKVANEAMNALSENREVAPYVEELQYYVELDPLQLELKWILGLIFFTQGDYTKADELMGEILEIEPNHTHAIQYFKNRSEDKRDVH